MLRKKTLTGKKKFEPVSVRIWKKQITVFFFKTYQMKKESMLALMNQDEDYFSILKMELSKPVGKLKNKKTSIKSSTPTQKMDAIEYFINDIYSESDDIRSIPVNILYINKLIFY